MREHDIDPDDMMTELARIMHELTEQTRREREAFEAARVYRSTILAKFDQLLAAVRGAGARIGYEYGPEAKKVVDQALAECWRELDHLDPDHQS